MKTIGIYGGTFSPVHNGHINAARSFVSACGLDELIVMPAHIPPHKQIDDSDDPEKRLEMTRLAFQNDKKITVSDWEITQNSVSYTAKTLEHFKDKGDLWFLCGTDMFLTLDSWYRPDIIFSLASIAIADRCNDKKHEINMAKKFYEANYAARIKLIDNPVFEISSSEIRKKVAQGDDISEYVPEKIAEFIKINKLYL